MMQAEDFTQPVLNSHAANELEQAMADIFTSLVQEYCIDDLNDIYNYGAPWQGGRTVVERFTKLNGLAVLRREDESLSDKLMAIIYANWESLASARGLAFLQFVLDMLYPNQNEVIQLWHSKAQAGGYPLFVSETQSSDRFLTSRVRIKINSNADIKELSELVPTLSRLVPWHIVPEVAVAIDTTDIGLSAAVVGQLYQVANFSPY